MRPTAEKPRQHPFTLTAKQWYVVYRSMTDADNRRVIASSIQPLLDAKRFSVNVPIPFEMDDVATMLSECSKSSDKIVLWASYRLTLQASSVRLLEHVGRAEVSEADRLNLGDTKEAAAAVRTMTGAE